MMQRKGQLLVEVLHTRFHTCTRIAILISNRHNQRELQICIGISTNSNRDESDKLAPF